MQKNYVTYEEFGAIGDGITDDFAAIYKAHEYANEKGLSILGREGAHYYVRDIRVEGEGKSAIIKTNVNWNGAEFTIDDRDFSIKADSDTKDQNKPIFIVASDYEKVRIEDREILDRLICEGFGEKTTKLSLHFDYPVMIIPYNSKHNVYRRRAYKSFRGQTMREVILLDKEGNVDKNTPLMFDYNNIDCIDVYRIDVKPITVEGATFTTRANQENRVTERPDGTLTSNVSYLARSINVSRPYTTLKNIKHYITDEPAPRAQVKDGRVVYTPNAYHGFFQINKTTDVLLLDCILTAHRCYRSPKGGTMGTYDLTGNEVNNLTFKNCIQSNFWIKIDENGNVFPAKLGEAGAVASMENYAIEGVTDFMFQLHWGIGGSNFCKNLTYDGSTLSRFDAHCGLYNGKIINSTVNAMALTGKGEFIVENTVWYSGSDSKNDVFSLRSDYGSVWDGQIKAKGLKAYINPDKSAGLVSSAYYNWYYGYDIKFSDITVDDILFYNIKTGEPLPAGFEVELVAKTKRSIFREPTPHLDTIIKIHPDFPDVDDDGDGLVDGTNIPYDDVVSTIGVIDNSSNVNLNKVTPPTEMKILNNEGGKKAGRCRFVVYDTSKYLGVTDGGFFGKTRFLTENEEYVGTDFVGEDTETFKFVSLPDEEL